jgi:hypothetical protein
MMSGKARLGLVLAMLAMVLAVSIPAVADEWEDDLEADFAGEVDVEDVDCDGIEDEEDWWIEEEVDCTVTYEIDGEEFVVVYEDVDFDGDGWNDDEDEDDDNDGWNDDEDEDDDNDGWNDDEDDD